MVLLHPSFQLGRERERAGRCKSLSATRKSTRLSPPASAKTKCELLRHSSLQTQRHLNTWLTRMVQNNAAGKPSSLDIYYVLILDNDNQVSLDCAPMYAVQYSMQPLCCLTVIIRCLSSEVAHISRRILRQLTVMDETKNGSDIDIILFLL